MQPGPDHSKAVALWLAAVLAGCSLSAIGVAALAPRIVADLGLAPEAIGLFSGTVWGGALVASIVVGPLAGRGNGWSLARASATCCALGVATVAAGQPALLWIGAVLIGIGQGLEAPPASRLLGHHVPAPQRPLFFSLKQTGVQVGAVAASLLLPALSLWAGWRGALLAAVALLATLAWALARPAAHYGLPSSARPVAGGAAIRRALTGWADHLGRGRGLLRLALAAASFGATQVCMNTFLVTWLVVARGASLTTAGALAATAQGAGLVGRPLWGWVASRGHGARPVLVGLGLAMAACSALLGAFGAGLPLAALVALVAAFGLSASGWNGVFLAEVAQRCEPDEIAGATAAAMLPLYLGLICGPLAFAAAGRAAGLSAGFVLLAGAALVGALLLPRARPPGAAGKP